MSMIEVLVVVAILTVMMGLLLPAMQKVREMSKRATCQNNLKQINLALANYESELGYFPGLGDASATDTDVTASNAFAVTASILPYVDQSSLKQLVDYSQPAIVGTAWSGGINPVHDPAAGTRISLFLCPSDQQTPLFTQSSTARPAGNQQFVTAGTNYMVNIGTATASTGPTPQAFYDASHPTDGVFWYGSQIGYRDLTDGSSNTLLLSETVLGTNTSATSAQPPSMPLRHYVSLSTAVFQSNSAGGFLKSGSLVTERPPECDAGTRSWAGKRGSSWFWGGRDWNSAFSAYAAPNASIPDCGAHGRGWFLARSQHPGGVNVALGDGSVRFIPNSINLATWRALATRSGGEVSGEY